MKYFTMNPDMKYIIYGAGGNCYHVMNLLKSSNYFVTAILDKRAQMMSNIDGVIIYTLEQFAALDSEKEKSIVIVSIKNVFEHVNITRELLAQGYEKIIYKPFPTLQGERDKEWDSINDAYEMIVEKETLSDNQENQIACSRNDHLIIFKDELLIQETEDQVLCWLPIELLCNYNREDPYQLLPMAAYYPLLNLYQYLLYTGSRNKWDEIKKDFFLYSAEWVDRVKKHFSEDLKNSMLNSRLNVFTEMQKKAEIDKNFFIRNAVSVKRINSSFRFYLSSSGRNRVSFLIAKGYRFIPTYMEKEDYAHWINLPKFQKFKEHLEKNKIHQLFTTIPHPKMISYLSETTDYVPLFCMPVIKEIYRFVHWKSVEQKNGYYIINLKKYKKEISQLKIFAAVKDEGCIGRLLSMYGINCYRWNFDSRQKKISDLIDMLFEINLLTDVYNDIEMLQKCQILIIDSRVNIPFISNFKGEIIFFLEWENQEFQFVQDIFIKKKLLFQSIWKGKEVAGWMLEKKKV